MKRIREEPVSAIDVLGMSRAVRAGHKPIQGARVRPEGGATGWFIWSGESDAPFRTERFEPLCVAHACALVPAIEDYLNLPAGYRFLIDTSYSDHWFEAALVPVGFSDGLEECSTGDTSPTQD